MEMLKGQGTLERRPKVEDVGLAIVPLIGIIAGNRSLPITTKYQIDGIECWSSSYCTVNRNEDEHE